MPPTHSYLAYNDCQEAFNKALTAERGVRMKFASPAEAIRFRLRMNDFRQKDREVSKQFQPADSPLYGTSQYDTLVLSIPVLGYQTGEDGLPVLNEKGRPKPQYADYIDIKKRTAENHEFEEL